MRIEFSPPDITEEDVTKVSEVLRSRWITTGAVVAEFEEELARWCSTPKVAALNSATAALECALALLAIGPGDEVITTAYTYTASASVICHAGATPVLVDVIPGSYMMDPNAVAAAVTTRTKAVIPVDVAGVVYDYDTLRETISSAQVFRMYRPRPGTLQDHFNRLPIIADGAHSFGGTHRGRPSGSIADFTAFSFQAVKNLTTAEGGALTWRSDLVGTPGTDGLSGAALDEEIYRRIKLYSLHGQDKDALAKANGNWEYDIVAPLYKCNMTDIAAALGLSQLRRYQQSLDRRKELVEQYTSTLREGAQKGGYQLDILSHSDERGSVSSRHLMMVRLTGRDDDFRRRLIVEMSQRDVACNVHYKPLPLLSAYAMLGFNPAGFPNAMAQYENEITLPLHTLLTDDDVSYVCDSFHQAWLLCDRN
jgi:dTDP-4-amino-4,6-dideoxygalactose transaminase